MTVIEKRRVPVEDNLLVYWSTFDETWDVRLASSTNEIKLQSFVFLEEADKFAHECQGILREILVEASSVDGR